MPLPLQTAPCVLHILTGFTLGAPVEPLSLASLLEREREARKLDRAIVSFGNATYFSNPASTSGRNHLSIRKSSDSAASWTSQLLVQAGASAGYSCLVKGALHGHPDSGGLLYEASDGTIKFARFPLSFE